MICFSGTDFNRFCIFSGLFAATVLAIAAVIKKEGVLKGAEFFPKPIRGYQTVGSPNFDFTITPHIPGNWTTGRED